jgi:hypothetical protein
VAPGGSESSAPGDEDDTDPERSDGTGEGVEGRADTDDELASAAFADDGSTSPPWGALVGVVLISVLAGAAVLRSRARSRTPAVEGS